MHYAVITSIFKLIGSGHCLTCMRIDIVSSLKPLFCIYVIVGRTWLEHVNECKPLVFIDVLQPCPTYNDINTKEWFQGADNIDPHTGKTMPRTYKLEDTGYDGVVHNPDEINAKMGQVIEKSNEREDRIPIGVFYQNEHVPTYIERIAARIPNYVEYPPAIQKIADEDGKPVTNIDSLLNELRVDKSG